MKDLPERFPEKDHCPCCHGEKHLGATFNYQGCDVCKESGVVEFETSSENVCKKINEIIDFLKDLKSETN